MFAIPSSQERRHQTAEVVVGIAALPELAGVEGTGDGEELTLGAATPLSAVEHHPAILARFPAFAAAAAAVSSPPLRHMGTLGGNLLVDTRCTYYNQTEEWRRAIGYCMKAEGEICWVAPSSPRCWAHSASDTAPMLIALGARAVLRSVDGEREVAVEDLYRDDGIEYLGVRPGEVLTRVLVPAEAEAGRRATGFVKLRRRGSIDFAVLSVAVALRMAGDTVEDARIVLGAVASRPAFARASMDALAGRRLDAEAIAGAAALARKDATPMDNTDFQAQWRGAVVEKHVARALEQAAGTQQAE